MYLADAHTRNAPASASHPVGTISDRPWSAHNQRDGAARRALYLLFQNVRRGAISDAHTIDAHVDELEEVLLRADAARALDLDLPLARVHHDLNDLGRGTDTLTARVKARGGLDVVRARRDGTLRTVDDLLFRERICLDDDLNFGAVLVADIDDRLDIRRHIVEVAAAKLTVVRNNVEIHNLVLAAVLLRLFRLGLRCREPEGEVADDADAGVRTLDHLRNEFE